MKLIKAYYNLAKPGIIYGNALTAAAGFFLASAIKNYFNFWLLLSTLVGTSLVIGSACVFNNFIDRDIDLLMARTRNRALVTKTISGRAALIFATFLGLAGFSVLTFYTNLLTVGVGIVGFFDYVILYGLSKRRSIHGTLIGSISGATPIVAGYVAVTNNFDPAALILFLILVIWQMPHFYAIAIYRFDDYKAAGIPALPIIRGVGITKIQMLLYVLAFVISTTMLTVLGYTGYSYLAVMLLMGLVWLGLSIKGFWTNNEKAWARRMFLFSLVVILSLSIMVSVGAILR